MNVHYTILLFLITTAWADYEQCNYRQYKIECSNPPDKVTSLQILHVDIPMINRQLFSQFKNVKQLNLHNVKLEKIDTDTFEDLKLEWLDLGYNRIKTLQKGLLDTQSNISRIRLTVNNIESIEDETFLKTNTLKTLLLQANRLKNININTFKGLSKLEKLNLSANGIENLDANVFDHVYFLADLDLSGNCLSILPENLFSKHNLLESLFLSYNQIKILPDNVFHGLRDLKQLDLSHNEIVYLPDTIFYRINNLRKLKLHNNNLFQLNTDVFAVYQPKLSEISLHNNLWKCEVLDKIEEKLKLHRIEIAANPPKDQRCFNFKHQ